MQYSIDGEEKNHLLCRITRIIHLERRDRPCNAHMHVFMVIIIVFFSMSSIVLDTIVSNLIINRKEEN